MSLLDGLGPETLGATAQVGLAASDVQSVKLSLCAVLDALPLYEEDTVVVCTVVLKALECLTRPVPSCAAGLGFQGVSQRWARVCVPVPLADPTQIRSTKLCQT